MIIDTHCHLDFKDFDNDRDAVIDRAVKKGVIKIINVGSSIEGTLRSLELARRYDIVYASIGVHPHEANSVTNDVIERFRDLAREPKVVAVGEVGLDYYRNISPRDDQIRAFKSFIRLAQETGLPLIIHSRDANEETLRILKAEIKAEIKGVMHCFSGDINFLKECLGLGLHISFTCNLTFKNASDLREIAKLVPTERLLLETDAPFLAPQILRGKRNEPAYLEYLVDEWTRLTALSKGDIERITAHNANSLFGLGMGEESRTAYPIRGSLYLNITNRCTNTCDFCVRNKTSFVKGHNLKLEHEPSVDEILKAAGEPGRYTDAVFCGYGEPTARLDVLKAVAKELKKKGLKLRVVTNGHGSIINSRDIIKELAGLVDRVSVSLNAETEEKYNTICKPEFGPGTYHKVLDFIKGCVDSNIETEVTCLDLPGVDIGKCEAIAHSLGADFRLRHYGVVG